MSAHEPPDDAADPESVAVERLVHDLRGSALSADRLADIERRLGAVLDQPVGVRAVRRRSRPTRWIALAAAAIVLVGAATYAASRLTRRAEPPAPAPTEVSLAPAPPPSPSPSPLPPNDEALPAAPPTASAPRSPAPSARAPVSHPSTEEDLLARARERLQSSPAAALSIAEEHARLYPRGQLVQEREVIAIDALARLGRPAEAQARGQRFLAAYPRSIFRTKVEQILAR